MGSTRRASSRTVRRSRSITSGGTTSPGLLARVSMIVTWKDPLESHRDSVTWKRPSRVRGRSVVGMLIS